MSETAKRGAGLVNLAVFLSGRGTNFEAIAGAVGRGELDARIALVVSNTPEAGGLVTAGKLGIPTEVFNREEFPDGESFAEAMLASLRRHSVEFIALAGYIRKIPPRVIAAFPKRIVNIHPALLPKYGGRGMYGMKVHEAVLAAGDAETGVTVHYVTEGYDEGAIIAQSRVAVLAGDTPQALAARVLKVEHDFYTRVLQSLIAGLGRERG